MSIHREYFEYYENSKKKYGLNTIVLMQIGSFHEAYATLERGYNLNELSEILNIICTRKDKSNPKISDSNPMMLGFPSVSLNKFIKILMENGFTVVVIDQVTPPPKPKREITQICSPGTYIEDNYSPDSNYITSLYIEEESQFDGSVLYVIGLSAIDLTTGDNMVHEVYSSKGDDKLALDEAVRFNNRFSPKEIIIYRINNKKSNMSKNELISYLEVENKNVHYYEKVEKHFNKVSYKNQFLKKVFPKTGMLTPIEYLDLAMKNYALMSYVLLLDFAYQHNEKIIDNIFIPKIYEECNCMVLGNNATQQLNIIDSNHNDGYSGKVRSLFDVVNKTSTAMGRRLLKERLLSPLIYDDKIASCHNTIEKLIEYKNFNKLEMYLDGILDLERLNRRLSMNILHPQQFSAMIESLISVKCLINLLIKDNIKGDVLPDKKIQDLFKNLLNFINEKVNITEMKKYNINDITGNFFNEGIHNGLDKLQEKINNNTNFMNELCKKLSILINDKSTKLKNDIKVSVKYNERDRYYLMTTNLRAKLLKKNFTNEINVFNKKIKLSDLLFKNNPGGSSTKIFLDEMNKKSDELILLKHDMMTNVKEEYINFMQEISLKYEKVLFNISKFISNLDFLKSGAKVAKLYNYCKPQIVKNKNKTSLKNGYFNAKKLRHPIVERVNEDKEYIPHNFSLGKGPSGQNENNYLNGMLIYGLNSCGKSTSMKSIGLAIVLAQSGYYVPAEEYYFSPYTSLYARITGNDNIFKGLSSYALEMTELRAILRRTGERTLVIGDEICRGTEHISGISIVATTINRLAKTNCSFIFATHIHELPEIEEVKELKHVKPFHLVVTYDKINDKLIFDRKLKSGTGERIYGITVAKFIIQDNDFIKTAQKIKNRIMNRSNNLLSNKTSNYSSNMYIDKCQICKKEMSTNKLGTGLETHHINFQKDCEDGFVKSKKHIKKNDISNLAIICEECHNKTHDGKLRIEGYVETSNGIELNIKNNDDYNDNDDDDYNDNDYNDNDDNDSIESISDEEYCVQYKNIDIINEIKHLQKIEIKKKDIYKKVSNLYKNISQYKVKQIIRSLK